MASRRQTSASQQRLFEFSCSARAVPSVELWPCFAFWNTAQKRRPQRLNLVDVDHIFSHCRVADQRLVFDGEPLTFRLPAHKTTTENARQLIDQVDYRWRRSNSAATSAG